jgi:peptidoglycan/xylan/chitin deacetylase (PgdA/CDA1 family)
MFRRFHIKRFVIVSISLLYFGCSRLATAIRRLFGLRIPGACAVIYYHGVRPEDRPRFARQMDTLMRFAVPIRADRREPLEPGRHYAAVTFDDAFRNIIDNALPELRTRGIPATVFVITEALGQCPNWLTDPGHPAHGEPVMSLEDLKAISCDLVAVGSHTMNHPRLPELAEAEAARELLESRIKLEWILGKEVKLFSFPYGAFSPRLIELCRDAGYERVFTILPYLGLAEPGEFITPRISVEPTDSPLEFCLKLMGAYSWLPVAFSVKSKLRSLLPPRGGNRKPAPVFTAPRHASPVSAASDRHVSN